MKKFEFDKETGTITNYNGNDKKVVIPAEIDGVKVTKIGVDAFIDNNLKEVKISENVTKNSDSIFDKNKNLKEVTEIENCVYNENLIPQKFIIEFSIIAERNYKKHEFIFKNSKNLTSNCIENAYKLYQDKYKNNYESVEEYIKDYVENLNQENEVLVQLDYNFQDLFDFCKKIVERHQLYTYPNFLYGTIFAKFFKNEEKVNKLLQRQEVVKIKYDVLEDEFKSYI